MKGAAERAGTFVECRFVLWNYELAQGAAERPDPPSARRPFRAAARERRKGRGYPGGVVPDHISDSQCPARCILAFTYGRL